MRKLLMLLALLGMTVGCQPADNTAPAGGAGGDSGTTNNDGTGTSGDGTAGDGAEDGSDTSN